MVQKYNIMGAQIGSHYLAMGVLSALFGGTYLAVGGGGSKASAVTKAPPINASSSDEENFIKNFLDEANKGEKTAAKH
ncbi:hypothetical protein BKA67DRAFT_652636 [Truncatella angustata]|uniref:Uncharacterized protein n=1 Tax=Truncatella angustata TaxID=152316 RepID=A0A9P9A3M8_9PEZI|nr:uncharacterized protein BKA67DRAFT_652636 [Truncatella angustata]KAH6659405.1 hypothetical protein BKA67DRAFT_652636 [Truncatella angustata]